MLKDIYQFVRLDDKLLSSGQPSESQLADIAAAGVRTVINLALPTSDNALPDERASVQGLGMEYVPIPVVWDAPQTQDLEAFMDAMDARRGQVVYVHCVANYRASCFIALYRILRLGWTPADAFAPMRAVWDPADYPAWQAFIRAALPGQQQT